MRITLLTYGSRGDVQPYLALAVGLKQAGHEPLLTGPGRFADLAGQYEIPFVPLAGDPAELSRSFNDAGANGFRMVRAMQKHVFAIAPQVVRQAWAACQNADLLVHSFLFTTGAHTFARQLGLPDVSVQTFPMFAPTRAFPNVAYANVPPGPLSYFSHWMATKVFWYGGNSGFTGLRKKFPADFPKTLYWPFKSGDGRKPSPLLFAFSPTVLPRPADWTGDHIHIPGYFFLDEPAYQPPPELERFLQEGDAPVCVSFGSMVNRHSEKMGRVLLESLEKTRQRAVILTGWGTWKPAETPPTILYVDSAPHSWLFPRCKIIVHHGGAGTTGAALRSGKPNIVVPFAVDQPFWARRVHDLGAGPAPIPAKKFTVAAFTRALEAALGDSSLQERAAQVGAQIRSERGVAEAVRLIEACTKEFISGSS